MKFDVCIMNPPYKCGLHLRIIESVYYCARETINISPAQWLNPQRAATRQSLTYRKKFNNKISEIYIINSLDTSHEFGISKKMFGECAILHFSERNKHIDLQTYGFKNYIHKSVCEKISPYSGEIMSIQRKVGVKSALKEPCVALYSWREAGNCFDSCIKLKCKQIDHFYHFDTYTQKQNFINSFKTIFMQAYYKMFVQESDGKVGAYVFVFADANKYNTPVTDETFCKHFGITEEEFEYMKAQI